MKGRKPAEKTIESIIKVMTGKKDSFETRRKKSLAQIGKIISKEKIEKTKHTRIAKGDWLPDDQISDFKLY